MRDFSFYGIVYDIQIYAAVRRYKIYVGFANLDMDKVPASRMEFDACGHYARPDVLQLNVLDK